MKGDSVNILLSWGINARAALSVDEAVISFQDDLEGCDTDLSESLC